jgi:uncharacterized membrane protein (UPF0182 family)
LVALLVLFALADRIVDTWTDWLWFNEVKYTRVFTGVLSTRIVLFVVFGLAVGLVLAGNLYLAYRVRPLLRPHSPEQHTLDRYRLLLLPRMGSWIAVAAVIVGLFAGVSAQGRWQEWLLYSNGVPFGTTDPQFHVDIGFYVFDYPWYRYLLGVGFGAVVVSLLGALAVHYLLGGIRLQGAGDRMTTGARAHLTALVAAFVLLKAAAYFLDQRGLLLERNDSIDLYGGGYTDINALLPAKEILAWISVVVAVAILVFSNAFMRNLLWPGLALALLGISAVAIGGIYPAAVQSFTVKPSPLVKEPPYIQRSIEATRQAYGLANVRSESYPASVTVPSADLGSDQGTVANVRLLDPAVVNEAYTQLQQVRGFYEFADKLDIDRYTIAGKTQDYVVGVREINYDKLTTQQSNWQNRHTVFTHGYGFTAAPANRVCGAGLPYFVSGFLGEQTDSGNESCTSPTELITTAQPRIYYGERMVEYAIVGKQNGKDAEFDRPTGSADQYVTYDGTGGVPIGSFGRRLLYAAHFRETNFLLSSVFTPASKLMYIRDPRARVSKVAPFLTMDGDPYPAVVGGRIVWILDAYTTASTYPYSQRLDLQAATSDALTGTGTFAQARQDINYLSNSVKATVDAYNGSVTLYAFDETDPVLKAWNKAFGGQLIKPRSAIPNELNDHLRYPEDQFKVQRDLLARFHVTAPNEFFNGQNFWQVPNDPAKTTDVKQPPYYIEAKFPGQDAPTFQLTTAVTPRNRQNLAALMSASYSNGNPVLKVLELPATTLFSGPSQVHQKMQNQDAARREITLFESSNSKPEYGNLLSLPVGGGMLFVEPLYIRSTAANAIPLLKKVLLNYGDYLAYADNLQDGIKQLVQQATGQTPPSTPGPPSTGPSGPSSGAMADAVARMQAAIAEVHAAQQSGDFDRYGKALKALDEAIKAFEDAQRAASNGRPSPAPSGSPSASPGGG